MGFYEAVTAVKKKMKAKRSSWKNDEYLWYVDKFLVHSKPYSADDTLAAGMMGHYAYMAELGDIEATDWEVIKE